MTPNVTLRPEWDLESVITDTYKQLGIDFEFMHVKSHQDDDGPVADLTLEAQLNVQADTLATAALQEASTHRKVALFPTAKCQLILAGASITRRIPQAIRFQAGAKDIQEYLRERNKWTQDTLDEIDWTAHGAAHSHHRSHRCFLVKLCHRHLPTGKTLHRRDNKYPSRCPGCNEAEESHDHFIGCPAPSRITWRVQLLTAMRQLFKMTKTGDSLQALIIDVLDRAMAGRPISVSGPFERALRSQERIGWRAMLHGHWSVEWQTAYNQAYQVPPDETPKDKSKRKISMALWQKRVIVLTWQQMIQLWKLRNDERHGIDTETRESARREVLTNELKVLYTNKDRYPTRVQKLLRESYEAHCTERVSNIQNWMDSYRATFEVTRDTT